MDKDQDAAKVYLQPGVVKTNRMNDGIKPLIAAVFPMCDLAELTYLG